ncbi:M48 family metallopeptidase [Panacagrimonas sp.]|uniref:M48 family metallopeptidase n=1 Tax=Panacagrimonas sp. TaxID=2480088 RepID=UPI003B51B39B
MTASKQLDLLFDAYRVDERISARARCIRIEVRSPSEVRLTIPRFVPKSEGRAFLLSREAWIREKIAELELRLSEQPERASPQLKWDGSDRLMLRGREVPLRLLASRLRKPAARLNESGIDLFVPPAWLAQPARLHKLLKDSLKHAALDDAQRILNEEAQRLAVRYSGPRIADQKTLWGSCTAQGLISLSWRLVMAPPAVLRYVAVHELCHVRYHDHSERFWKLVARQMPGFETHRRWLREHGPQLHWCLQN